MPVRAVVMERNEELKAQSAFVSTQRVLQLTILPEEKSFRCHQPQLGMAEEGPMPHCSPQLSPALSLKGAVIDTGWYHDTVLFFFGKRIGKDADNIAHHHLMTALSKTPDCCPQRLGASSPPGLA